MNKSTSDSEQFVADVDRYTRKCDQHLNRAALFRTCVLKQPITHASIKTIGFDPIDLFDNEIHLESRFIRAVTESHFLLLKANFEFYLFRTLCMLWDNFAWPILGEMDDLPKGLQFSRKHLFKMAVSGKRKPLPVAEAVVPVHGLNDLEECFNDLTSASLKRIIQQARRGNTQIEKEIATWDQLHCAFEVRHLLEHRKGRVDKKFLDGTEKEIRNSSWLDRYDDWKMAVENNERPRVGVTNRDFEQTLLTMKACLPGIRDALIKRCRQFQQT